VPTLFGSFSRISRHLFYKARLISPKGLSSTASATFAKKAFLSVVCDVAENEIVMGSVLWRHINLGILI
jgi:hypothetical protein